MYFVKYGDQYLHDPRNDGFMLLDLTLTCEQNSCGYCDFTIYPNHPLYDTLKEHDAEHPIEVYDNDILLFAGFIYELGKEFYLDGHVKCKGEMDYLSQSIVRPYATYQRGFGTKVPDTLEGYFEWLIEQHNAQVDANRRFTVGINQASWFGTGSYEILNDEYPTTIDEISDIFIGEESYGGYLQIRHVKGQRIVDLLADWKDVNTQLLDFGVNLTDYTMTDDSVDLATFVVPTGATMDETEYEYDDGYFETRDTTVVEDRDYYTKTFDYEKCEDLEEFETGVTYYEYFDGYSVTSDETPQSGKTYYTKSKYYSDKYDRCEDITEFESGVRYYEYDSEDVEYFETSDVTPSSSKTYYTYEHTGYSKVADTLIAFEPGVTYYEYDEREDESKVKLTIVGLSDTTYNTDDFAKSYDHVYSKPAVKNYGMIGYSYSNTDITTKEELLTEGLLDLMNHISPYRTIEVKAVDMHLINPDIKPIRIGEYVRVRSRPHDLDSYFICRNIELDLNNPENSIYTLTTSYNRVYGEENSRIVELNAGTNKEIEAVESIADPVTPSPTPPGPTPPPGPTSDPYLTFKSDSPFTIAMSKGEGDWDGTVEYSNDQNTWAEWDGSEISSAEGTDGNYIYMRGSENTQITASNAEAEEEEDINAFNISGTNVQCSGNVETLLDYMTVKNGEHPEMTENCYYSMFCGCLSLITAPTLPATTLVDSCYLAMFYGCTSLTTAPTLPATTLAVYCYAGMFYGCTNLTTAPDLPATTLAECCYTSMFSGCTSLTTPPALPATTLDVYCYSSMFYGCENLKVSETQTGPYQRPWRIPTSGTGVTATDWNYIMLTQTGGTFTDDPTINTTYYIDDGTTPIPDPCLTFKSDSAFTIRMSSNGSTWDGTVEYSTDHENWTEWDGSEISSEEGSDANYIYMRGSGNSVFTGNAYTSLIMSGSNIQCVGNIENLLDYEDVENGIHPEMGDYCYANMFRNRTSLTIAPELPAIGLSSHCYYGMFYGCSNLTTSPTLPATTLGTRCYSYMFYGCSSLTTPPTLPATTLAESCYEYMFYGCSSLTTPPTLPATTLADYCYYGMFYGCSNLTTSPTLPATTLGTRCYSYMFYGCSSLTTPPTLPATTLADYCYYGMFQGCSSLTTAPTLPVTTLADYCYAYMFEDCTSLTTAPSLPATTLTDYCYTSMFYGCESLTIAPELPATILSMFCYASMFKNCTSLIIAPELPATMLADYCYELMFLGCTSLTTAPALPATTLASYCYGDMFNGCTSLTTPPALPATTLGTKCYEYMFMGCTSFKVSASQEGIYQYAWRIPTTGTGTTASRWNFHMLTNTGGTFTSDPTINTTYYVENAPV